MYVLAECGLVHKYLFKKENVKNIEEKTLLTVNILKDLSNYTMTKNDKYIVFRNDIETLRFKKSERAIEEFQFYLDEYNQED